jgi:tRNA dimethylallyltransferase
VTTEIPPFYVVGPTGSGKSDFAEALAQVTGGEIVNADAYQIYRGLPVLTACPSTASRAAVRHHLYEVVPPERICDAGRYLDLARPVLAGIVSRGKLPIVTGGSGLYVKALTHGLNEAPGSDPALRRQLDQLTPGELQGLLRRLDPVSAASITPENRRYVQRAVEVCLIARQPASSLRQAWANDPPGLRGVCLVRPRAELHLRIHHRVRAMWQSGALEEVRAVGEWSTTSSKAIGVAEIREFLQGNVSREACIAAIETATRRYAKRQITWFRRERWLTPIDAASSALAVAKNAGLL